MLLVVSMVVVAHCIVVMVVAWWCWMWVWWMWRGGGGAGLSGGSSGVMVVVVSMIVVVLGIVVVVVVGEVAMVEVVKVKSDVQFKRALSTPSTSRRFGPSNDSIIYCPLNKQTLNE